MLMHFFHHSEQSQDDGKTKVKICGIRRLESAEAAVRAGADFLGFNFVNESSRFVNPIAAKEIIEKVHHRAQIVGVFKDMPAQEINELAHYLKLHYVQLHGSEDPTFVGKIKTKVLKAVSLSGNFSLDDTIPVLKGYHAHHILLDRQVQGQGFPIDFGKAREVASHLPIFLAGGLHTDNVAQAIAEVNPFAVDVAGGIETNGYEDTQKIAAFVQTAKGVSQ